MSSRFLDDKLEKFRFKSDLFYANSVVLLKSHFEFHQIIYKSEDSGGKMQKKLDCLMKTYAEQIKDNSTKKIIKSFIKNDDYNLIESIKSFLDEKEKNLNSIYDWAILEMKKDSYLVTNMLNEMEQKKLLDKSVNDPKFWSK